MRPFVRFPRAVSREFHELHMDLFPALKKNTPAATALLNMAEFIEFGPIHWDGQSNPHLILSQAAVAALVGMNAHKRGFRALDWINRFSDEVFPLDVIEHRYAKGLCRMLRPAIPPVIQEAKAREVTAQPPPVGDRVYFASGKKASIRNQRQALAAYDAALRETSEVRRDHPGHELLQLLNTQPSGVLDRLVQKVNWPDLYAAWQQMPRTTDTEHRVWDAVERVLLTAQEFSRIRYREVTGSLRLYSRGNNIQRLPRTLRKLAVRPGIGLDLKNCQLAVVARLWGISSLQNFLRECLEHGVSFWSELLGYLGVGYEHKPTLKNAVYALVFGMSRTNLLAQVTGAPESPGIGEIAAERFLRHPLIADLLRARDQAIAVAIRAGGVRDAFGHWIACSRNTALSALAQQAQSYELRLMLVTVPIIRAERDMRLLSFLHDGFDVWITDRGESRRKVERLKRAVSKEAERLGVRTGLELGG